MLIMIVSVLSHFRSSSIIHNCLQEFLHDWQANNMYKKEKGQHREALH